VEPEGPANPVVIPPDRRITLFGLFAVFLAVFCTLEPFKVQLKSIRGGAVIAGGVICAIGYNS
jgi:hypothetical protein